ncbi:MAG: aminotransferase class V-fold PLP-dependent enzyme [Burkholderiaceae bacterium]
MPTLLSDRDVARIREDFPHLDTCVYLDTGATGLAAPGVGRAAASFYEDMLSRGYDAADEWRRIAARVQARLAALLNVRADEIVFTATSSDALNRLVQALPVRAGDRVTMTSDEFPTLDAVCRSLAARGAAVQPVAIADEAERTDRLCAAADGAAYVLASHVHWSTGTRIDLERLSSACLRSGARLIIDGVHAVGAVPVDASLTDAYVTSFFKWTLAGFGIGALVVRAPMRDLLTPAQIGYANLPPSRSLQHSHLNYPGLAALECALDYLGGLGWSAIFERVAMLQCDLATRLRQAGHELLTPGDAAGLTCVRATDPERAAARLRDHGIRVSPRGEALRVSTHFYNLTSETARFCEALSALQGQR